MQVTFVKRVEKRLTYWHAIRNKTIVVPGSTMALGRGDMPHDLKQLVVEAAAGISYGFWGSVSEGATFNSTGRKRTRPGRAVIAKNRAAIDAAEICVGAHVTAWQRGKRSASGAELSRLNRAWNRLGTEESLTVSWPSLALLEPHASQKNRRS